VRRARCECEVRARACANDGANFSPCDGRVSGRVEARACAGRARWARGGVTSARVCYTTGRRPMYVQRVGADARVATPTRRRPARALETRTRTRKS
jgi:hypothetical protein